MCMTCFIGKHQKYPLPARAFRNCCLLLVFLGATAVPAEELPYPPTYFSEFRVDLTVALDVAEHCNTLEIDPETYDTLAEEQFQRLEEDGFSREHWRSEMKDIPVGLRDRPRLEFYFKWGARSEDPDSYCRAGRYEIENGTRIGSLLRATR